MELCDARTLTQEAQEALRKRAVKLVLSGMTQQKAADIVAVARGTVARWMSCYRTQGEAGLAKRKRGRRVVEQQILTPDECRRIRGWITDRCPEQMKLPFALWERKAVRELILCKLGKRLALSTVGAYLRRWGYTAQRPKKQAVEQQPERIRRWLEEEYPAIERRAKAEGAEIHWCDESGLRTDSHSARSYAPKGQTPVIRLVAKRGSTNMISTVTNQGKLRFMVYDGGMNADTFIVFLRRLLKTARNDQGGKKIFLILGNLRVHHAKKVKKWVRDEKRRKRIELFFLPP